MMLNHFQDTDTYSMAVIANYMMLQLRVLLTRHEKHPEYSVIVGAFDVKIAEGVLQKLDAKDLSCSAQGYMESLATKYPQLESLTSPWQSYSTSANASSVSSAQPASQPSVWEYDAAGKVSNALQLILGMGFSIGSLVAKKSDNSIKGTIVNADNNEVTILIEENGSSDNFLTTSFLANEWSILPKVKPQEFIDDWMNFHPSSSAEFETFSMKALISTELSKLTHSHTDHLPSLRLQTKPYKSRYVTASIPKGKLILVPSSMKVECASEYKKPDQAMFHVCEFNGLKFWLNATIVLPGTKATPFICPTWFIEYTTDPDQVNLEIKSLGPFGDQRKVNIPVFRNTKALNAGDQLFAMQVTTEDLKEVPRAVSKAKATATGKGNGKSKAKSKAHTDDDVSSTKVKRAKKQ